MHAKCLRDELKAVIGFSQDSISYPVRVGLFVYSSNWANRKNYVDESSVNGIYFIASQATFVILSGHTSSIMTQPCR